MNVDFWYKQTPAKPLFPDIEWQKPEQKSLAGKLLIIGGNKLGFAAVAQAYADAQQTGIGECRVMLPDSLKPVVDKQAFDCVFAPSNPSGGFSKEGLPVLEAGISWADGILLIGDMGRNSETAIALETILAENKKLIVIARDTIDLLKANMPHLVEQPNHILILTLAQLQKVFQSVYYPKVILFSMQLTTLVETLHKFTITYPCAVIVFHQNQLLVAKDGRVSTTPWEEPMLIWRGSVAARAAVYALQHRGKLFEALTSSLIQTMK